MNPTSIFLGVVFGAIGTGYFIYGKKQSRYMAMLAGLGLCFAPYFFSGNVALSLFSLVLLVLPFIFKS